MKTSASLEDCLEIFIITYDRSDFLRETLRALSCSQFVGCCVSVIDNCSHDATASVVSGFFTVFPRLTYIKNHINIGGNPNYLKAISLAKFEYAWVLCDDDFLDFSDCNDVIKAIESGAFDLIEVGVQDQNNWPRGEGLTVGDLLARGLDYYSGMTFFPAFIFRTELFDGSCLDWGHKNHNYLYPQFEFLNKSRRENFTIYLAAKKLVGRNEGNDHPFYPLEWLAYWVLCCNSIEDEHLRITVIEEATHYKGFFKGMAFWTILDRKLNRDGLFFSRLIIIMSGFNLRLRFKYALVLPLAFLPIPMSFWLWLRTFIYKAKKVPQENVPPITFVNR